MMNQKNINIKLLISFLGISILFIGCRKPLADMRDLPQVKSETNTSKTVEYPVQKPPFSDGIFPCNDCHDYQDPNPQRRELVDMHDDISAIYDHDSENRWCTDCHDLNQRDSLRLASGKRLGFDESYLLCGQCHGDKLRDWKVGVHGKRIGDWNGRKEYLLCVNCHNPHSPKFKEVTPEPPPLFTKDIK